MAKGVQANWIHRGAPRPANPVRRHPAKSVWTVVRMIMTFLFYVLSPFAQGAADWRSGKTIEYQIGTLTCTPFPASRDFAPVGSMSLDFQVASLSYKSSSFATSRGNERYEEKNSESYTSGSISAFSPFGGCRHHLARWEACHMTQKENPVTLTL